MSGVHLKNPISSLTPGVGLLLKKQISCNVQNLILLQVCDRIACCAYKTIG